MVFSKIMKWNCGKCTACMVDLRSVEKKNTYKSLVQFFEARGTKLHITKVYNFFTFKWAMWHISNANNG